MYIPKINLETNRDDVVDFMNKFSFATIITAEGNFPVATHLPFLTSVRDDNVVLTSHFSRANNQWTQIENYEVLVIFAEPHAYISPKHYDKELNVPTWNYISVHAYGKGKILTENEKAFEVLESTIKKYEAEYQQQWDSFHHDYKLKLLNGIIAFEIVVSDLLAKKKLSQNKTAHEQSKIIDFLSNSNDSSKRSIADYMLKNLSKNKDF